MKNNHIFPFLWMRGEEEAVLRTEMEKIAQCGIGAVCLEARPHDQFCQEGWWHDVDIILDEARKRDMKIWILDDKHFPTGYANGLIEEKYPERKKWYIYRSVANISGYSGRKMTLNVGRMTKPAIGFWEIDGFFARMEARMKNRLLAVIAVKRGEGNKLLDETIDLTDTVNEDGFATFTLPDGAWAVHVIFRTQTDGGNDAYINMIDKASAATQIEGVYEAHWTHYKEEFGKTIAGFFSDEPQMGNFADVCYDAKLGKKKMPLSWSDELEEFLKERWGQEYARFLPYLFEEAENAETQYRARYDYMDGVSRLYQKNFCEPIGKWCREHGVEYVGHVVEDNGCHSRLGMGAGHIFRSLAGQDMAGIDVIGEQVVFGAPRQKRQGLGEVNGDGEFYHYTLGKLGASVGHLDPKKKGRTLCELFGAYGWNFGVRDMKYVLDHLLVRGVNELVPHAFSMAEYPDADCPPHFYARGNNPEFPAFAELMKYANRMCEILSGGVHVPSVAVLYDGEADWTGGAMMPMQKVARALLENQIDFDFVPTDYLKENGACQKDRLVVNGLEFAQLLIPYTADISRELADFLLNRGAIAVNFVGGYPECVIRGTAGELEKIRESCGCVSLDDVAAKLEAAGLKRISLSRPSRDLTFYHYRKADDIYVFQNESAVEAYEGTVRLPQEVSACYDGFTGKYMAVSKTADGEVVLRLNPGELVLFAAGIAPEAEQREIPEDAESIDLSFDWNVELIRPLEYPTPCETMKMDSLVEISESHPTFSGIVRYRREFRLDGKPEACFVRAGQVYEILHVLVNGQDAGFALTPPYQKDITEYVKEGTNELVLEVLTTPARDQLTRDIPPFDFSYEAMEATGLAGRVELLVK